MNFEDGLHVLEKMLELSKRGWTPGHKSWKWGMWIDTEHNVVHTACGHEVPLHIMYSHLLRGKGPIECPHCPDNPVLKIRLPEDVYDSDS